MFFNESYKSYKLNNDDNMEATSLINAKVEVNESPVNTLMMVNKSNKSYKHENER